MKPSILLIEDDEISRSYLTEAIRMLDFGLTPCADFAAGLAAMAKSQPNLIISDVNLPDGALLMRAAEFPSGIPILAISAELTPATRERLAAIGIHNALSKPMPLVELHASIHRLCGTVPELWNQSKALKALGGSSAALRSMRAIFIRELPVATLEIQAAFISGNLTAMHDTLHKLKASCGFLGVEHLLAACHRLDQTPCLETFAAFQNSAADTLTVIRASDD
jgi:CheY-like chemotaxis protein